jgi:hypothetical protein
MDARFEYGLVAPGTIPLAEYSLTPGKFATIAMSILEAGNPNGAHARVEREGFIFIRLTDLDRMNYVCGARGEVDAQVAHFFVDELKRRWFEHYGIDTASFARGSKSVEFGQTEIESIIRLFNDPQAPKLLRILANINECRAAMVENLTTPVCQKCDLAVMEVTPQRVTCRQGGRRGQCAVGVRFAAERTLLGSVRSRT